MSARARAWKLWTSHGLFTIPLSVRVRYEAGRKPVKRMSPGVPFAEGRLDLTEAAFERIWEQDAPGLALLLDRQGLTVLDADTPAAHKWVQTKKLPRTPTVKSRRGMKWLFRGRGKQSASDLHTGLDVVISFLPLPPTPGYEELPSLRVGEVEPAPMPEWMNGDKKRRRRVRFTAEPIVDGTRHVEIIKKLARLSYLDPDELLTVATALNQTYVRPPLPDAEIRTMVEYVATTNRLPGTAVEDLLR